MLHVCCMPCCMYAPYMLPIYVACMLHICCMYAPSMFHGMLHDVAYMLHACGMHTVCMLHHAARISHVSHASHACCMYVMCMVRAYRGTVRGMVRTHRMDAAVHAALMHACCRSAAYMLPGCCMHAASPSQPEDRYSRLQSLCSQ